MRIFSWGILCKRIWSLQLHHIMILLLAAHILLLLRQLDKQSGTFNKLQEPINPLLFLSLKKIWFDWMVYPWQVFCWLMPSSTGIIVYKKNKLVNSTGLKGQVVIKSWGLGISPAIMNKAPGNFHWKIEEKWNQKKSLAVWFPANCCIYQAAWNLSDIPGRGIIKFIAYDH